MIRSFRSKALKRFAETGDTSKLSVKNEGRVRRILLRLDQVEAPEEMNAEGLRFHPLKGQSKGRYAVWASGNYRITFGWSGKDAIDVDLEDYH
ncbi:MAG TPA: type II toxin-antitoxin system RelE/ParE family toxin [Rhizomicrobium sp.]|nr:type II toxin-antitoxin system RelE/ParE family toxin [Rhizomicrobium sp.]